MQPPHAELPLGTTLATIRSRAVALPPKERRVAELCVERPDDITRWSAADLAEHANTSTATVVRACQKLGFDGFQHLRMLLVRDLGAAGAVTGESESPTDDLDVTRALFAQLGRDLNTALTPLDTAAFDDAIRALRGARRILVAATGGSASAAAAVAFRLTTHGRFAEAPTDAMVQRLAARSLTADDACLAVSDTGMNPYTVEVVAAAKKAGATVVGVTSYHRSTLVRESDIGLVIGTGAGPWATSGTSTVIQLAFLIGLCHAVTESTEAPTLDEAVEMLTPDPLE